MRLGWGITPRLTLFFVLFAALLLGGLGLLVFYRGRAALENATVTGLLSTALEKKPPGRLGG